MIGWITKEGEFIKCDCMQHRKIAEEYFPSEAIAEMNGWIKIAIVESKLTIIISIAPNYIQISALQKWAEDYKKDLTSVHKWELYK